MREDGSVFGTLCGIHPAPQPQAIVQEGPLIELLTKMLSTILAAELKTAAGARREERVAAQQHLDPITDLYDRRAWAQLLAAEETRCRLHGNGACVVVIDLGRHFDRARQEGVQAMDDLLRVAAGCVTSVMREQDIVARIGDSTLAVLALDCDRSGARALVGRLNESLAGERVDAAIAVAHRAPPLLTLDHAWSEAERTASEKKPA
jgi:diguanylate cyclase (GGDEF)-like protein